MQNPIHPSFRRFPPAPLSCFLRRHLLPPCLSSWPPGRKRWVRSPVLHSQSLPRNSAVFLQSRTSSAAAAATCRRRSPRGASWVSWAWDWSERTMGNVWLGERVEGFKKHAVTRSTPSDQRSLLNREEVVRRRRGRLCLRLALLEL